MQAVKEALVLAVCLGGVWGQVILDGADLDDDFVRLDGFDDYTLGEPSSGQVRIIRPEGAAESNEFLDYEEPEPAPPEPEAVQRPTKFDNDFPEEEENEILSGGDALLFPTQYPPPSPPTEAPVTADPTACAAWRPSDPSLNVRHSAPGSTHVFAILKCSDATKKLVHRDAEGKELPGLPADILRCRRGKWTSRHFAQSSLSPADAKCV